MSDPQVQRDALVFLFAKYSAILAWHEATPSQRESWIKKEPRLWMNDRKAAAEHVCEARTAVCKHFSADEIPDPWLTVDVGPAHLDPAQLRKVTQEIGARSLRLKVAIESQSIQNPPAVDPPLTKPVIKILEALSKSKHPLIYADLAEASDVSQRLCKEIIPALEMKGLVNRPNGPRRGFAVTPEGRTLIAR